MAPPGIREKLVLASESAILCPSNASQLAISAYLANHDWRGQIKAFREVYRERRDATLEALAEHIPEATWTVPEAASTPGCGCRTGWMPARCCPAQFTRWSPTSPVPPSTPTGSGAEYMRLSYCYPTPERIREGVRRLGTVVSQEAELVQLFGGEGHRTQDVVDVPGPEVS